MLHHLLVQIVEHNDQKAFSKLFDFYYSRLLSLAMVYIPRYEQAEEIVSDVFLKLLLKKKELLKIKNFSGYLFFMVKTVRSIF